MYTMSIKFWVFVPAMIVFELVQCYNIDTNNPIIYNDDGTKNYYGYSVILYGGKTLEDSWIQIGAPRDNPPLSSASQHGAVFRCNIGSVCNYRTMKIREPPSRFKILKNETLWYGAAMDIDKYTGTTVVCGYRTTVMGRSYYMIGSCFSSSINESAEIRLSPLHNLEAILDSSKKFYNYGQGEAGFAAHFTKAEPESELLLGAPGVYNWKGVPLIYGKQKGSNFLSLNVASGGDIMEIDIHSYLGYSLTSGYFFNKSEMMYVSGAPRSKNCRGQILLFKFDRTNKGLLNVEISKRGTQLGEYFGAALTSGDINSDGYDDLIVGAPYYSNSVFNEGRVYVFLGNAKRMLEAPSLAATIEGSHPAAQFGASIMFLSDIDLDGYGDIAVGAPYEQENSGAIYIYRGSAEGLIPKPSQIIVGKNVFPSLRGFGISISKPDDVDNNKYSDIAVGAYLSGHVVLLRTRPTVAIEHSIYSPHQYLHYNSTEFQLAVCFMYRGQYVGSSIPISRTIVVDHLFHRATLLGSTNIKRLALTKAKWMCENVTLLINKQIAHNFDPLSITLSHVLIENSPNKSILLIGKNVSGFDNFCPTCSVYNKYQSSKSTTHYIPIALGCKSKSECVSKLFINATFENIGPENTFVSGSLEYLKMPITIGNEGEKAFLTQIVVKLPTSIKFRSYPSNCVERNTSRIILCDVDNPLTENRTKNITVDLDMTDVNAGRSPTNSLDIVLTVLTNSKNLNNNTKIVKLNLLVEADVTISGKSQEQSHFYGDRETGSANFSQIYQVEKIGVSAVEKATVEIRIPTAIQGSTGSKPFLSLYYPEAHMDGQPLMCTSFVPQYTHSLFGESSSHFRNKRNLENSTLNSTKPEYSLHYFSNRTYYINCSQHNVICSNVVCKVGPFRKSHSSAIIRLRMLLNVSSISGLLEEKDVIALSISATVTMDSNDFKQKGKRLDFVEVTSMFLGQSLKRNINIWIVLAAIAIGFLLLILLIILLAKAGFFKRTAKLQLEAMKEFEQKEEASEGSSHNALKEEQLDDEHLDK